MVVGGWKFDWFAVIRRRVTGHPELIGLLIGLVWTNAPTVTDRFAPKSRVIVAALLLVGFGSREQERLRNLGNAVALAVRYSFDIFFQVRSELEARGTALTLTSTTVFRGRSDLLPISNVGQQVLCLSEL
jgi:hypothetical protein